MRLVALAAALLLGIAPAATASPGSAAAAHPSLSGQFSVRQAAFEQAAPPAQPPAGDRRVTFGVRPATAKAPDNRPSFGYGATPGAVVKDYVAVSNVGTTPVTLKIYASDAFNTPEGGFDLLASGKKSVDVGAWTKPAQTTVSLKPRSVSIVPFSLTIPANATPGDHAAGIVAALTTEQTGANGQRVSVEQRVGARIYLRVTGQLTPRLAITGLTGTYDPTPFGRGDATVSYVVRNTGNTRLSGTQRLGVSTPWGSTVDSAALPPIPELLPGGLIKVTTKVSGLLPAGWLDATVHVDPHPVAGFTDPVQPVEETLTLSAVPWAFLGILLVLILGVLAVVFTRRRRRRAGATEAPPAEEVAEHAAAH
ncbi:DUF916 domain-containing protein [Amycolatopsis rhabdoformis]|uniref:DUF916 domain-containing protein n=1 Tax=Amycolatopsis rhabdoformis TaxID=1448059 RepID=A0ABZ1IMW9_9PSEU|nr:DUF916 domain-containing protein [Amycolatopsis rhabdoformis]WSE35012.1 DUF916 domain-containing protein [Amycolatopsis rhabdoformis]